MSSLNAMMIARDTNMSTVSWSEIDPDMYKDKLSDETAILLLPAIIVFGIIMIMGALGNSLVLFVYFSKFRPSYIRTAILALAVLDLITCGICIPGEILDMRYSYNYTGHFSCKSQRFLTTAVLMASGFTLVCVANDRYRRICYPLQEQSTARDAVKRVLVSCLMATVLAIPAALVYGVARVPTSIDGIHGLECSTSEEFSRHPLRMVYNIVLCVVFLFAFTAMIVYYVLIGRRLWYQEQFRDLVQSRQRKESRATTSSGDSGGGQDLSVSDGAVADNNMLDNVKDKGTVHSAQSDLHTKAESQLQVSHSRPTTPSRKPSFSNRVRKVSQAGRGFIHSSTRQGSASGNGAVNSWRVRKTTSMLFIITLIFVVSFLPHLALKATQAIRSSLLENLSASESIAYNVMVRSYFFNAAINWIVYGLCSPKFRRECRALLKRTTLKRKMSSLKRRPSSRISDEAV